MNADDELPRVGDVKPDVLFVALLRRTFASETTASFTERIRRTCDCYWPEEDDLLGWHLHVQDSRLPISVSGWVRGVFDSGAGDRFPAIGFGPTLAAQQGWMPWGEWVDDCELHTGSVIVDLETASWNPAAIEATIALAGGIGSARLRPSETCWPYLRTHHDLGRITPRP